MPYDASPYTKEELEALRHPPTKCVNLSDPVRWLATIDSIASRCEEAVALLKTARIECEPLCPNGVSNTRPCECSRSRVAAFLEAPVAPPAPESKVEKAPIEVFVVFHQGCGDEPQPAPVPFEAGHGDDDCELNAVAFTTKDEAEAARNLYWPDGEVRRMMLAAERDAGRGA